MRFCCMVEIVSDCASGGITVNKADILASDKKSGGERLCVDAGKIALGIAVFLLAGL